MTDLPELDSTYGRDPREREAIWNAFDRVQDQDWRAVAIALFRAWGEAKDAYQLAEADRRGLLSVLVEVHGEQAAMLDRWRMYAEHFRRLSDLDAERDANRPPGYGQIRKP